MFSYSPLKSITQHKISELLSKLLRYFFFFLAVFFFAAFFFFAIILSPPFDLLKSFYIQVIFDFHNTNLLLKTLSNKKLINIFFLSSRCLKILHKNFYHQCFTQLLVLFIILFSKKVQPVLYKLKFFTQSQLRLKFFV